jgi:hypothetical protein
MNKLSLSTQQTCNVLTGSTLTLDGELGSVSQAAIAHLLEKIKSIFHAKNYQWDVNNLIGIRMSDIFTDAFTDVGVINVGEKLYAFPISTKPGSKYLEHPENAHGTSCLAEGQYPAMWQFHDQIGGWTGDPYCAQISRCTVFRQIGKKAGDTIDRTHPDTGLFGINFHTWHGFNGPKVYNLSAGCQVMDEEVLMNEIHDFLKACWPFPHSITYTLLHRNDFK